MMTSSGREALKWLALVLMTGDHINAAFFDRSLPYLSEIARVAFPVFAFVLAYNLTDRSAWAKRGQIVQRLVLIGLIAQSFHPLGPLPLNVLYSFATGIGVVHYLSSDRGFAALALFLAAGFVVGLPVGRASVVRRCLAMVQARTRVGLGFVVGRLRCNLRLQRQSVGAAGVTRDGGVGWSRRAAPALPLAVLWVLPGTPCGLGAGGVVPAIAGPAIVSG